MSGHRKFSELTKDFSPQRQARIADKVENLKKEMALNELRQALELSQEELAQRLNIKQPAVSRLENRDDMYVSHLREVIEAMGGKLDLTAHFSGVEVKIELRPQP
ncbi:MAG: XRE family transcriptional regulator [Symploca sp. SIO2G7]|nr:XRE family transcriptional regulator [Symploca sp. SIO2G7]